jgi:EAL domain-containing protein (putative c-di-GMP-specific phosphodiesterase class I)
VIPAFRDAQDGVVAEFEEHGYLAAVLIDLGALAQVERAFGEAAFRGLREQVEPLLEALRDQFRREDRLTRDDAQVDRFLLFLAGPRRREPGFRVDDLRRIVERVECFLAPRVGRLARAYLRERPVIRAGYGIVLRTPRESLPRQLARLVDDAATCAELRARVRERQERERLLEIVQNREIWTAFQPIVAISDGRTMGWEALARGPRGTDLESPAALFSRAARIGITEELERTCRRQAFLEWPALRGAGRLFVNTVPATIRDPSFHGRGVLNYLGRDLSPSSVTLEITERSVIENLPLYREAMHAFTDLGFSFAIDDVGAGYSGLETVAALRPAYLKIDLALVRDVHLKRISQQVVKAILDMSRGLGATVIAEGIETKEEANALQDLGVAWGQGYYFGRPIAAHAPREAAPAAN